MYAKDKFIHTTNNILYWIAANSSFVTIQQSVTIDKWQTANSYKSINLNQNAQLMTPTHN